MPLLVGCLALAAANPGIAATTSNEAAGYERADAQRVKACTRQVISDPRFAHRISFSDWLVQRLVHWRGPGAKLPPYVGEGLFWAITVWCVLTLLAIIGHLIWTIWLMARPGPRSARGRDASGRDSHDSVTFEHLWQRSTELAQRGAFREAVEVLLLALLGRLESMQVLQFHKSKTNGEYIREYPGQLAGRREFTEFIVTFEKNVYGGLHVPEQTHRTMSTLAERIIKNVSQGT